VKIDKQPSASPVSRTMDKRGQIVVQAEGLEKVKAVNKL
jgi:hypothetical protein